MRRTFLVLCSLSIPLLGACDSGGSDRVISIDATGVAAGLAYVDRNGDGKPQASDALGPGIAVALVLPGGTSEVARATTDANGLFVMKAVPVGRYRVVVDTTTIGDTLRVEKVDSAMMTVRASDTVRTVIALGYRPATVAQVRQLPVGRTIQVEGIALNGWTTFGDSTVHLADASGAIRAVQVRQAPIFVGDSVRMVGTVGMREGQVVLTGVQAVVLASAVTIPAPTAATAAVAAKADSGRLDAALVHLASATITAVARDFNGSDYHLKADDGSGWIDVTLDGALGLAVSLYTVGMTLDVTGLLVPATGGAAWVLKPRDARDLVVR